MKIHRFAILVIVLLASPSLTGAQQPKKGFEVTKIADRLYELSVDAGGYPLKVIASVGPDGVLIVDSAVRSTGPALAEALKAFGQGMPKIIINTHSHIEHLGGNVDVGRGALIIGHRNLRDRYLNGLYAFGDIPPEALPNLTFTDSLSVYFNGEEIRLAAFTGAHDDSDIVVWFTKSKVAVVGALCMGRHFPSIDGDTSDVRKYPETTAKVLAFLPDDVRLVPGHAEDCDMAEARRFLDMLQKTSEIVRAEMAKGKNLARLQADDVLAAYASYESSYVKRAEWIEYWYSAYTNPRVDKPKPFAPVIRALREQGAESAMEVYSELRRTQPDQYWFEDQALMWMGRRLARLNRLREAEIFLERCIKEFPGSDGAAVSHQVLASVFEKQGDFGKARLHLGEYLVRHPEDQAARQKLVEIEGKLKK